MNDLGRYYCDLLQLGFIVIRQAIESSDKEWPLAELEMLHNIPSLINETNPKRHEYYWTKERRRYLAWANLPEHKMAKSQMMTYYDPIWKEMEPLVQQIIE